MKRNTLIFLSVLFLPAAFGGPAEDIAATLQGHKDTIALLRQGKLPESRLRLIATLPAGVPAATNDLALGRQWVTIAFHFHTRGEWSLARQAAEEALAIATAAMDGHQFRSVATNSAGFATSNAATLTVTAASGIDLIIHRP